MRFREFSVWVLAVAWLSGCEEKKTEEAINVGALADLTTRQLIAGLNSKNEMVLAGLIVMTSTSGGEPRPLKKSELEKLVYPSGPFEYEGAGKPGTMVLRDGKKLKRVVRLVKVGGTFKVLATNELYSTWAARELGGAAGGVSDARVVSFMTRD